MNDFQEVTNQEIHDIASPIVMPLLEPLGFEFQKLLHWVNSDHAPVRQIFSLRKWKGGSLTPSWGLSLDFVPHLSGKKLRWHRTKKSAIFDLTVDAHDRELDMTYIKGPEVIQNKAPAVISEAIRRAIDFWVESDSIEKLPKSFQLVKKHLSFGGLGFYNYTQHPIAHSLVLAKNGRLSEAEAEMDIYIDRMRVSEDTQIKLREILNSANAA